jgi:CBS domain containing-hemolysin-like protein
VEHISTTTLIVTLIVMVIISAYFSGSETGMMTLNRYRLRHMAKQGNRPAKRVEKLLRKPDRLISLCSSAITSSTFSPRRWAPSSACACTATPASRSPPAC